MMRNAFAAFSGFTSTLVLSTFAWAQDHVADPVAAEAAAHDAHHAASPGLPQLDVSTFPSQLFWLVVCGVTLYGLMSKVALPRVQKIIQARDHFVHDNLHRAATLRHDAEGAKIIYDRTLQPAAQNAKQVLHAALTTIQQQHEHALQAAMSKVQADIDAAEARLHREKERVMESVDQSGAQLANEIMLGVFETKPAAF